MQKDAHRNEKYSVQSKVDVLTVIYTLIVFISLYHALKNFVNRAGTNQISLCKLFQRNPSPPHSKAQEIQLLNQRMYKAGRFTAYSTPNAWPEILLYEAWFQIWVTVGQNMVNIVHQKEALFQTLTKKLSSSIISIQHSNNHSNPEVS